MKSTFISGANYIYDGRTRVLSKIMSDISSVDFLVSNHPCSQIKDINTGKHFFQFVYYCIKKSKKEYMDILFIDNRKATVPGLCLSLFRKPKCIIYDARELYLSQDVNGFVSKIGCFFEKKMIQKADIVIAANEYRKKIMEDIYPNHSTILTFENYRNLTYDGSVQPKEVEVKYKNLFESNLYTIISTAGCELERNTMELVKAFAGLPFQARLLLVGCKDDEDEKVVRRFAVEHSVSNIFFIERVDQNILKYLISKSNLGIAMYHKKNANNLYCSSGKVFEFVYEGIPVAVSDNPPLKEFIDKYGVGTSSADISDAINKAYARRNEFPAIIQKFQKEHTVESFINLFKEQLLHEIIKRCEDCSNC